MGLLNSFCLMKLRRINCADDFDICWLERWKAGSIAPQQTQQLFNRLLRLRRVGGIGGSGLGTGGGCILWHAHRPEATLGVPEDVRLMVRCRSLSITLVVKTLARCATRLKRQSSGMCLQDRSWPLLLEGTFRFLSLLSSGTLLQVVWLLKGLVRATPHRFGANLRGSLTILGRSS